ncbi:uncharacterized protein G2W53_029315 [Senna tora]|uniref:Uncharacterized protein n=1 Tax=Senna tora TaxID=362788 RepID=A0A834WDL6_9FABA|nr:uncharacterized protein G2W53_029315 [Senna tora]
MVPKVLEEWAGRPRDEANSRIESP